VTTARRRPALRLAVASGVDLAVAIDAFLSQPDLAPTTRAKYRQTLAVIEDELGDAPVTGAGLAGLVAQRWHHASPATWNRHVATVRSFARYCERTQILEIDGDVELARRAEKHDHTRSIALASLERLWERRDIDLRERTLWRLLYETAARADEVLRLNVEDLDIPGKRARTRSKGGDVDWLFLRLGQRPAAATPDRRAPRRAGIPLQPAPEPGPRPSLR
jgi:site-specific recombinase XerD